MHGLTPEWLDIAVGWGFVASVLVLLIVSWVLPDEKDS
jgi:hypothetical protein